MPPVSADQLRKSTTRSAGSARGSDVLPPRPAKRTPWAKTVSRSVIGVMNEFSFLANESRRRHDFDPIGLALWLAQTPCGPLYGRHISPDRELAAAVESWSAESNR